MDFPIQCYLIDLLVFRIMPFLNHLNAIRDDPWAVHDKTRSLFSRSGDFGVDSRVCKCKK